jgi:hypothetical protein
VGVDVSRLGLMVVTGQPKNTAEYIQATSRVGRDPSRPGLVLTLYNWARPRDLAHFETFSNYHETFYRRVEPLSVTPFSRRAVDRGLTAVLVAMIRNAEPAYSPNLAAQSVDLSGAAAHAVADSISRRAELVSASSETGQFVRDSVQFRLEKWQHRRAQAEASRLAYRDASDSEGLLREATLGPWGLWTAANSLRETEPEINLILPRATVVDQSLVDQPTWTYPAPDGVVSDDANLEEDDTREEPVAEQPPAAVIEASGAAQQ